MEVEFDTVFPQACQVRGEHGVVPPGIRIRFWDGIKKTRASGDSRLPASSQRSTAERGGANLSVGDPALVLSAARVRDACLSPARRIEMPRRRGRAAGWTGLGMRPGHCSATIRRDPGSEASRTYFEAQKHLARNSGPLDQRGVIGGPAAVALDTVLARSPCSRAAALEMCPALSLCWDLPA